MALPGTRCRAALSRVTWRDVTLRLDVRCKVHTFPSLTSTHRARASRSRSSAVAFPCELGHTAGRRAGKGGWVTFCTQTTGRSHGGLFFLQHRRSVVRGKSATSAQKSDRCRTGFLCHASVGGVSTPIHCKNQGVHRAPSCFSPHRGRAKCSLLLPLPLTSST